MDKDRVARKVADMFLNVQKRFAAFMNSKTSRCSVGMLRVSFILLCSIYISLSVWFIVDAFRRKSSSSPITVSHMRKVVLVSDKKESVDVVTAATYKRFQQFRKYMDSLRICDTVHYDSILLARPGLMDTVLILEKIYLQQQK